MTTKILFSPHGLGDIANDEIQNILQKYHLGALIKANKTKNGAMKQTMFVTSTEGVFVIKGNPVYKGQLEEEGFFISELGKRTNLSLPLPYKIDSSLEIFPYPYAIMPLLPGFHFLHIDNYTIEEKKEITTALVNALKEMHSGKSQHMVNGTQLRKVYSHLSSLLISGYIIVLHIGLKMQKNIQQLRMKTGIGLLTSLMKRYLIYLV